MLTITAFGGTCEIGGNMFLLNDGRTKIFLDFGRSFCRESRYFEFPLLQPQCREDLLKTGLIPNITGLYCGDGLHIRYGADETEFALEGKPCEPEVQAVLLSHAHTDHCGYIGLLHPDIRIYCSPITKRLLQIMRDLNSDFRTAAPDASIIPIPTGDWVDIGTMRVKRYDVDHSIPGASAFAIEADGKRLVYTGDFRLHGPDNAQKTTQRFIEEVTAEGIDYLLCEGTCLSKHEPTESLDNSIHHTLDSEETVKQKCAELFRKSKGLVIYDMSPMDISRLTRVLEAAQHSGRRVVLDSKKAFLLLFLNRGPDGEIVPNLPEPNCFRILLSRTKLRSDSKWHKQCFAPAEQAHQKLADHQNGLFVEAAWYGRQGHEARLIAQQRLRITKTKETIGEDDLSLPDELFIWGPHGRNHILQNPDEYVIITSNGPGILLQMLQMEQRMEGIYIYGKAEPFNEEMEFSHKILLNWLELSGLQLEHAHTSGHINRKHLEEVVKNLNPKTLIPIHTTAEKPFEGMHPNVKILPPGREEKL